MRNKDIKSLLLNLDRVLYRKLKIEAAQRETTMTNLIITALKEFFEKLENSDDKITKN